MAFEVDVPRSESSPARTLSGAMLSTKKASAKRGIRTFLRSLATSRNRRPWVLLDFSITFSIFYFVLSSKALVQGVTQSQALLAGLVFAATFSFSSFGFGLYDRDQRFVAKNILKTALKSWLFANGLTLATLYILFFKPVLGRNAYLLSSLLSLVLVGLIHFALSSFLRRYPSRFVYWGPPSKIWDELSQVGITKQTKGHFRYIASPNWTYDERESVVRHLLDQDISDVVISMSGALVGEVVEACYLCLQNGLRVIDEVSFYAQVFERYPTSSIEKNWFIVSGFETRKLNSAITKRLLDIVLSVIGLGLYLPIFLFLAILIKLTSPGPIIYSQIRTGRYGRNFKIYKLRTMKLGDSTHSTLLNDPRVTWIGKLIRPLHLDELPQLINILFGQMSFVGPRPEVSDFTANIIKRLPIYEYRYLVRPGLTGLAQIRQGYTFNDCNDLRDAELKLSHDLYYVKHHSLMMDITILSQTLFLMTKKAR